MGAELGAATSVSITSRTPLRVWIFRRLPRGGFTVDKRTLTPAVGVNAGSGYLMSEPCFVSGMTSMSM